MFDPFLAADPPVIVHEIGGHEFEDAWKDVSEGKNQLSCPQCGQGHAEEHGVSEAKNQAWIRYSCGDYVTQEVTAG